jgi:hypothetical protein
MAVDFVVCMYFGIAAAPDVALSIRLAGLGLQSSDAKLLEIASCYGQVVQGLTQWEET